MTLDYRRSLAGSTLRGTREAAVKSVFAAVALAASLIVIPGSEAGGDPVPGPEAGPAIESPAPGDAVVVGEAIEVPALDAPAVPALTVPPAPAVPAAPTTPSPEVITDPATDDAYGDMLHAQLCASRPVFCEVDRSGRYRV